MNPQKKKIVLVLALGFLSACSSVHKAPADLYYKEHNPEAYRKQSGEIVAFLEAVNNHEIRAAKIVVKKAKNPEVRSFAEFMIKEHGQNLKETKKISKNHKIPPFDSPKNYLVERKDRERKKTLKKSSREGFRCGLYR